MCQWCSKQRRILSGQIFWKWRKTSAFLSSSALWLSKILSFLYRIRFSRDIYEEGNNSWQLFPFPNSPVQWFLDTQVVCITYSQQNSWSFFACALQQERAYFFFNIHVKVRSLRLDFAYKGYYLQTCRRPLDL